MKRIINRKVMAICLAVVLVVSSIIIFPNRDGDRGLIDLLPLPTVQGIQASERTFEPVNTTWGNPLAEPIIISDVLYGQTPREGYILAPSMFGLTGVDTASRFVLRTPMDYNALPLITIDGQPQPAVTREDSNTFIVTPVVPLTPNSVYIFRLSRGDSDITWAFQTSIRFEVTSTFPRNQATNVPVRTGIEIAFSFGNDIDIEEHFSIYPNVEGQFIYRDSTTIFMPTNALAYGQIYTVTLSAGSRLAGTSEVITTNHTFSFETYLSAAQQNSWVWGSNIHFSSHHVEFPSFAQPSVSFWLNYNRTAARPSVDISVYRIDDQTTAIAATNRIAGAPNWSRVSQAGNFVDTANLTQVYAARIDTRRSDDSWWGWNETFTITNNLPPGFYVVTASTNHSSSQMIIQITDLAVQVIADDNMALMWVNDMTTGAPAAGAMVYDPITGRTFEASAYGIAVIERMLSAGEYLIITAADGKQGVVFTHSIGFHGSWGWNPWSSTANNSYWTAIQLDRTLFQRSDTVSLWGFVQNRHTNENITHVTAILTEGSWWWGHDQDTLHTQNIPVVHGAYAGEIRLPHLDPGFYELAIFHGDVLLNSIHFSVMDYVKPPYQLLLEADVTAIFAGEEVTFTARTEFFEGTPVPDLNISYRFSSWGLSANNQGQAQTNLEGIIERSARPHATDSSVQGERSIWFAAEATLPEIGWVHEMASVRVFVNDIHVQPRATRNGAEASLTVNVNEITLDRLNDGTAAHWGDFLCNAVAGHVLNVEVTEIYWERVREGERYNHITRQVEPRYRHVRRERVVDRFEIITDAYGIVTAEFQVPNRENASYQARITTTDGNGRTIVHYTFIGRDFTWFFHNANDDQMFLYGVNPDGYDIGDAVELTIMRGIDAVTQGNFLFVVVQNGIISYHIGINPLTFTFDERHVPNAQVFAFHFNGHTYHNNWQMSQRLRFNTESRVLDINITTCLETYRPGDMATFTITTADAYGNPKPAHVNIGLVDEALFSLMDYTVNTLAMLYRNVSDTLRFSMATHRTFSSDGIDEFRHLNYAASEDMAMMDSAPAPNASAPMATAAPTLTAGSASGRDTHVRERFEDTAIFASVRTNSNGEATFTFQLPDNITSWRVTASAISNDLYAGNTVTNVRVTQPMFLHYTLNSTFLVGDRPYIGVNAFGTSLTGGEEVTFEVWRENAPQDVRIVTGVSFARVNIPLWEMDTEDIGAIIIRATVAGYSDAVRHAYTVINSHRQIDVANFYDVTVDTTFSVNDGGLTNITFTDQGRGQFLRDLFVLRNVWNSGARIEGLVARREATRLIGTHFPDVRMFGPAGNFDVLEYQTTSGGIAVLPHAEADLYTTVMLLPFIKNDVNLVALTGYLRNIFETSTTNNRMLALYGLAVLGQPVLLDLQQYAMLDNLSVRNTAYIALGFAALGEMQMAQYLYNTRIAPHIQRIAPYYRVCVGTNRTDILDATSVVALLAAQLGMPESLGLHNYASRHRFSAFRHTDAYFLLNIERLLFITHEINNHTNTDASITYTLFGETITRQLGHGGQFTLRIPAQNMHEFNIIDVTGEVGAVSIVRVPLEEVEIVETDLTIRREFFKAGTNTPATTFEQGDLIRVEITIDYSRRSLTGSYIITDFLPAGLVHVPNSARFGSRYSQTGWWAHARTEGQRVTFFDFNSRFDRIHTYFYYARVVSPGIFIAEGTIVQSVGAREYMAVGEGLLITINP